MPQPTAVTNSADEIIGLLEASQDRIAREQRRLLLQASATFDPRRRLARLSELNAFVAAEIAETRTGVSQWIREQLGAIYARGGQDAVSGFTWTRVHRDALEVIAADTFESVATALAGVDADAARWVRQTSRALTAAGSIEGRTPQQLARELRSESLRIVDPNGDPTPLTAVRYANGTNMPMAPYAAMLMRTQTAIAYNLGSLNRFGEVGVEQVRILDGSDCGLTSHDDASKANGRVVPISFAYQYPIAHPQCRRSFVTPEAVVTEQAQRDQTAFERATANRRRGRQARSSGTGRTPRQSRATTSAKRQPRAQQTQVIRPGDRFRNTGDWREDIADDWDVVQQADRTRWRRARPAGDDILRASDEANNAVSALKRIGARIEAEVARRIAANPIVDPGDQFNIAQLERARTAASLSHKRAFADLQKLDRHNLELKDFLSGKSSSSFNVLDVLGDFLPDDAKRRAAELAAAGPKNPLTTERLKELRAIGRRHAPDLVNEIDFGSPDDVEALASFLETIVASRKRAVVEALDALDEANALALAARSAADADSLPKRYREVLAELREFGITVRDADTPAGRRRVAGTLRITDAANAIDQIEEGVSFLPSDWLDRIDSEINEVVGRRSIFVSRRENRGWYQRSTNSVNLGDDSTGRIVVHEFTHAVQHATPDMTALEFAYLDDRWYNQLGNPVDEPIITNGTIQAARALGAESQTYANMGFPSPYTGRFYQVNAPDAVGELMPTGVEGVLGSGRAFDRYFVNTDTGERDDDLLTFVLGMLAAV